MKKISLVLLIILIIFGLSTAIYFYWYQPSQKITTSISPTLSPSIQPFNVIIVGWDGVQRDHFFSCYNKELAECSNGLPNIKELSDNSILNSTITNGGTETTPGWAQILTGYDAETTGIESNENYKPLPNGYTILEKTEEKFGDDNIATLFVAGKGDHLGGVCVGEKRDDGEIETKGEPYCQTKNNIDLFVNKLGANDNVGNYVINLLDKNKNKRFFLFVHFQESDVTGHKFGENSPEYSQAIINDDEWLGNIIDKLKALGIYDKTYLYVANDHGFNENDNQHTNAPFGIFATNDKKVVRSGDRKDIAPTILERFDITLEAMGSAPKVDGLPLEAKDPRSCIPENKTYLDYSGAPSCCSGLTMTNLDKIINGTLVPATGGIGDKSGHCIKI